MRFGLRLVSGEEKSSREAGQGGKKENGRGGHSWSQPKPDKTGNERKMPGGRAN